MNPLSQLLTDELRKRKSKNENYSMRAFARLLDLEPSALSKILKGQRTPSSKTFHKIAKKLNLSQDEQKKILPWLEKVHKPDMDFAAFDRDRFERDVELYHILMLEALRLPIYAASVENLRQAMGMEPKIFLRALDELERMNMLNYDREAGQVRILSCHNTTLPIAHTTAKLRTLQKKFLNMAARAVDECPVEQRDNSTLTVAIPENQLSYFKALMAKVRRKINLEAEKNIEKANVIYNFTFAVYPVVRASRNG